MRDPYDLVHRTLDRRYAIKRVVAEGGFGVVYEAEAIALGVKVAIKVLRSEVLSASPEARGRFDQEAKLLARLRHPGIVTLTDAAHLDDGTPYLALEWIDGETLDAYLARVGALPLDDALRLLGPVATAIAYAHEQGVVHRDLKPGNVMIPRGGGAKVLDFGVARWTAPQGIRTTTTSGTGLSIGYAAPEQYGKEFGPVDGRADQFALAAVVFATLTAKPPFAGDSLTEVMFATCMSQERPSVAPLRPDLPRAVDAVLRRALAIRPDDRYPTIRAFFAALEEAARHGDAPATSRLAPETAPDSPPKTSAAAAPPPAATLPSPLAPGADGPRTLASASIGYAPTQPAPMTGPAGTSPTGARRSDREPPPSEVAPPSRASTAGRAVFGIAVLAALAGAGFAVWPLLRPPTPPTPTPNPKPAPSISKSTIASADAGAPSQGPCGALDDDEVCVAGARISRGPEDCSTAGSDPAHQAACPSVSVYVKPFALERVEVSAARWAKCVEAGKCQALEGDLAPSLPVRGVTQGEAAAFCAWAKRRLPTDDEWELAAAGPEDRAYPWGNALPDPSRAVFEAQGPVAVDAPPSGASPAGVLHLAGNVAEWTATAAGSDAPWPFGLDADGTGERFWVRGGGFDSPWGALRSWAREAYPASHASPSIGLRCARTPSPQGLR